MTESLVFAERREQVRPRRLGGQLERLRQIDGHADTARRFLRRLGRVFRIRERREKRVRIRDPGLA
jgi:hypothetical protein